MIAVSAKDGTFVGLHKFQSTLNNLSLGRNMHDQ